MIHIDGIIFSLQHAGGISVYFKTLIDYLNKNQVNAKISFENPFLQKIDNQSNGVNFVHHKARLLERYRTSRTTENASVFHSSYYRSPTRRNLPTVVTVHDFIYERYQNGVRQWVHSAQKNAAIRSAQSVICISESTKDDLLTFVGEIPGQTVHVIHNGVSEAFHQLDIAQSSTPYILFVGQRGGYKNFQKVLKAMAFLPGMQLHCVGGGALQTSEFHGVEESISQRVKHLGFVTDEELNMLYNQAACLAYPSSYEGFGIPVIEAMKAGCPVVCVDCKAVLEVGGNALTIVYGDDPREMADAILSTLAINRTILIQNGFKVSSNYSWEKTHSKTFDVYRSLGAYK
jgi:mannosyltransferase